MYTKHIHLPKVSVCTCPILQGVHYFIFYGLKGLGFGGTSALCASHTSESDHCVMSTMPNVCFGCSYDGTVRNSVGDVIQFLYGEDGMDGAAIEGQTMEHLRWDRKKLEVCFVQLQKHFPPLLQKLLQSC